MKRAIISVLILIIFIVPVSSMELSTLFHISDISFDNTTTAPVSSFSGTYYPWGLSIFGSDEITDEMTLKAGVFYDPILRYTTYTLFEYQHEFFKLGVGPFFGTFNTPGTILKSGISTSVRVEIPGILFASLKADSSIGSRFVKVGDYLQEFNEISVGYYIPNAICSVSLKSKSFVTKQAADLEVDDSFTEYAFNVDMFQKNVGFTAMLSFAYQTISRSYLTVSTSASTENTLNSLILGTNFKFKLADGFTLITNLESNVYSFGYLDTTPLTLPGSGPGIFLFRLTTGVSLDLDLFKK
ncbi:MAG: hypothetical protein PF693_01850 [Spirochaetia bacterium]|jgi:hypothetical protein|nr:hypothetical protein [Spirochaetia bacterium]